jgi:hypothetical protein
MKKDLKMELFIGQSVHKLKHKISILRFRKSYYLAEEYENNLKTILQIWILILKIF